MALAVSAITTETVFGIDIQHFAAAASYVKSDIEGFLRFIGSPGTVNKSGRAFTPDVFVETDSFLY